MCSSDLVLLKQLQQSFLLDADTEIGVFEFGGVRETDTPNCSGITNESTGKSM